MASRGVAKPYEQGRSAQCYPYTETETPLPILSPCRVPWHYGVFSIQRNIGEVARSGEGVKPYNQKNSYGIFSTPLLRNFVPSVSPLYCQCGTEEKVKYILSYRQKSHNKKYLKTPPLCFAEQNIGEVARSDGEVKKYLQQRKRIKETIRPSPPCDKK